MIKTAIQLKAKIRNLSGGDNDKAKVLIRNFIMERFLERVSLSPYRNNFILKGGMFVAAVVGLETRATMDIDTTVKSLTLSAENARSVIEKIILIEVDDGVTFEIKKVSDIMEGHDYPGIRFMLEAKLDMIRQMIKIDISTGDIITPEAVEYSYKLMFENRSISLWTYNLETMLGEKLETIMARENANTRMRDFYDIFILTEEKNVDYKILYSAFMATSEKRETTTMISRFDSILDSVLNDAAMRKMWDMYRDENYFVGDLSWENVNERVRMLKDRMFEEK